MEDGWIMDVMDQWNGDGMGWDGMGGGKGEGGTEVQPARPGWGKIEQIEWSVPGCKGAWNNTGGGLKVDMRRDIWDAAAKTPSTDSPVLRPSPQLPLSLTVFSVRTTEHSVMYVRTARAMGAIHCASGRYAPGTVMGRAHLSLPCPVLV